MNPSQMSGHPGFQSQWMKDVGTHDAVSEVAYIRQKYQCTCIW